MQRERERDNGGIVGVWNPPPEKFGCGRCYFLHSGRLMGSILEMGNTDINSKPSLGMALTIEPAFSSE